jgi:hypothetical protein
MAGHSRLAIAVAMLGLILPAYAMAQSEGEASLGNFARSMRTRKVAASAPIIDNDNLTQVMDKAETNRTNGSLEFAIAPSSKEFQVISPDATCSLSFNANATALLAVPVVPTLLPAADLAKVDGPAILDGDTLEISVHNGSEWTLREITVGLTIVRADPDNYDSLVKLVPASLEAPAITQKRSDTTLLLHLKGTAAPSATAVFTAKLGSVVSPDQDWHWAIVEAKGIPSSPAPLLTDYSGSH